MPSNYDDGLDAVRYWEARESRLQASVTGATATTPTTSRVTETQPATKSAGVTETRQIWQPERDEALKRGVHPTQFERLLKTLKESKRFGVDETTGLPTYRHSSGQVIEASLQFAFQDLLRDEYPWAFQAPALKPGATKTVSRYDQEGLNANFEAIGRGEVEVVD